MASNNSVEQVKQAAAGRWPEILANVGRIDAGLLDGKHHPCPKCGGKDRFRLIDTARGAVLCNQCFKKGCGDGLAAIQWALGIDFPSALSEVASYLGHHEQRRRIVATYDYRDEQGVLLFQVCRQEPKGFPQRQPNGQGGWTWKLTNVRRVLYRLPELLAADPAATVFLTEGEKDADNLTHLGLIATTNCNGAGNWSDEYNVALRGRVVVILVDNDDPGRNHAQEVAQSLHGVAASVRIVELPDLPVKGDVSDWLNAGGNAERLCAISGATPIWEPSPSASIKNGASKPAKLPKLFSAFPIAALPHPIGRYVAEMAKAIGCDASLVALPLLAALASAVGNTRRIVLKRTWTEPCVLWTAIVGDSGTHKTPAFSAATSFLSSHERDALTGFESRMADYRQALLRYEAELAVWKRDREDDPPVKPEEPIAKRFIVSDTTIEALADRLQDAPRGLLLERDELSGWLNSFDQYKAGKGGDVAHWLTLYNARALRIDRKAATKKLIHVPIASVSITGGIQPMTLRRALGHEHFENGLAARMLLTFPPKRPRRWSDATVSNEIENELAGVFSALLALDFNTDAEGQLRPFDLPLTPAAHEVWVEYYNRHGGEQSELAGNEAALWSKLEGTAPRLALIVHLVRDAAGDPTIRNVGAVDEMSMTTGVALADWFGLEGRRIYGVLAESEQESARRQLVETIQQCGGKITANDLRRRSRRFETNEDAEAALSELERDGLGIWEAVPTTEVGGRPTREFKLAGPVSVSETPTIPEENGGFSYGSIGRLDESEEMEWRS